LPPYLICLTARRLFTSFPTRRSSDLVDDLIPRRGVPDVTDRGAELHRPEERHAAIGRVHAGEVVPGDTPVLAGEAPVLDADEVADRKSTRLNSSHVKISYAVFCLKKK